MRRYLFPAFAVALLAACGVESAPDESVEVASPTTLVATNVVEACEADYIDDDGVEVVRSAEGLSVGCDVVPPQRLDVLMHENSTAGDRCSDMGGWLVPDDRGVVTFVCEGVDY